MILCQYICPYVFLYIRWVLQIPTVKRVASCASPQNIATENQCELRVASCASPQNMVTENQCELRVAGCALLLSPSFSKRNSQPATDNENQFLNLWRVYG